MKKHIILFSVVIILTIFSCNKRPELVQLIAVKSTPQVTSDSIWLFNENTDGNGKWLGSGCAVNLYTVSRTDNNMSIKSGNTFRYNLNGTISRMTNVASLNSYTTFQYLTNKSITSIHIYSPVIRDTITPTVYTLGYQNEFLSGSRKHVKVISSTFDGFLIEAGSYSSGIGSLVFTSNAKVSGFKKVNGISKFVETSEPAQKILFDFLNNDISKPTQVKAYKWNKKNYSFSEGYAYSYDTQGSLSEAYVLDSTGNKTLSKKFYWDTKLFNQELYKVLLLEDPFNERFKLYPEELYLKLTDTAQFIPVKIEEYNEGVLSNSITFESEEDQGKIVKLTGSHSNGRKEIHDVSYTCN